MKQNICSMAYTLEVITWMDLEKTKDTACSWFLFLYGFFCFPSLLPEFAITILPGHSQGCQAVTWLKLSVEPRWNVEDSFEWSFFCLENKYIYIDFLFFRSYASN